MIEKENLYQYCQELINEKIDAHKRTLTELKESASNETKSTAGDKHETALAMLQIEQKNVATQLDHLLKQKSVLDRITPSGNPKQVSVGTLVKTNKGYFYISIALGKITFEKEKLVALSEDSPLGAKLMGLEVGEGFEFNKVSYLILRLK